MGSCVSTHSSDIEPAMKLEMSFGSKTDNFFIQSSPVKVKPPINAANFKRSSSAATTLRDSGSKEETFFDSQAWLESDCEDDFLSVNGDFTPSCGNTPVHHTLPTGMGTPPVNKVELAPAFKPELSPTHKRKKLSDLFKESVRGARNVEQENTLADQNGNSFLSRANSVPGSERTPYRDSKSRRWKSLRGVQCCLPSILTSRSYSESKKKMSPNRSIW
ncbi:hypothetical protein LguiA_016959 [Lonicera macranthoides]